MIRTGIIPQYKARHILAVNLEGPNQIDEIDLSEESFVWYKSRLFRPQQFLVLYLQIPAEERFKVLTFYEPYFRSDKVFFNHVAEEVHLMTRDHGGCKGQHVWNYPGVLTPRARWTSAA